VKFITAFLGVLLSGMRIRFLYSEAVTVSMRPEKSLQGFEREEDDYLMVVADRRLTADDHRR